MGPQPSIVSAAYSRFGPSESLRLSIPFLGRQIVVALLLACFSLSADNGSGVVPTEGLSKAPFPGSLFLKVRGTDFGSSDPIKIECLLANDREYPIQFSASAWAEADFWFEVRTADGQLVKKSRYFSNEYGGGGGSVKQVIIPPQAYAIWVFDLRDHFDFRAGQSYTLQVTRVTNPMGVMGWEMKMREGLDPAVSGIKSGVSYFRTK